MPEGLITSCCQGLRGIEETEYNPVPWIDSSILKLIKKKNSVRQKLKSHPNAGLRDKFKSLRAQVKKLLRESLDHFYDFIDTGFRFNPKHLWSI